MNYYNRGDNIEIIGYKPYYEFSNGNINKIDIIKLVPYSDNDYEFVYDIKKNAYKKYVVECWGSWNDDDQRKYYDTFINSVKENAFIIMNGNEKIDIISKVNSCDYLPAMKEYIIMQ